MIRSATRTLVRHCVLLLVVQVALDGSVATIDNATGAVRDNSLPSEVSPDVIDESNVSSEVNNDTGRLAVSPSTATVSYTTEIASSTTSSISASNEVTLTVTTPVATEVPFQQPPSTDELPPNCSEFRASPVQLMYSEKARIRKCCPPGQMVQPRNSFQYECVPGSRELQIETIEAQFYGNNECIEVTGEQLVLPVESLDLCESDPKALMYSADQGDELFVLQNGSLLVLEMGSLVSVFDTYCVEMTNDEMLLAKVCETAKIDRVGLIEFCMLFGSVLSVLALLATALCYSFVPKLKDIYGYLIAVHAGTFAIGTIFFGLARCGGRCINPANVDITETFANALLGSSMFAFFLMNVYNSMYVAYYIPNGLEYENKNKRDVYAFLAVLYCITLIPLVLFPKGGLVCIVFLYFGAIVVAHILSSYYTKRLTKGIYQQLSGQAKINETRLNDINGQRFLCLVETICAVALWIVLAGLILSSSMTGTGRIVAMYCIVVQGLIIGVLFVAGQQRWIILRECWSNSGSVNLREVENGEEMKTFAKSVMLAEGNEDVTTT
uniref:Methuselah N-terminal domain-containing protein n=1 Tax=Anopheles culicifacies TaxID=139723 RepID=A0A182M3B4_9DIPT